jgi:hypothetical protein
MVVPMPREHDHRGARFVVRPPVPHCSVPSDLFRLALRERAARTGAAGSAHAFQPLACGGNLCQYASPGNRPCDRVRPQRDGQMQQRRLNDRPRAHACMSLAQAPFLVSRISQRPATLLRSPPNTRKLVAADTGPSFLHLKFFLTVDANYVQSFVYNLAHHSECVRFP